MHRHRMQLGRSHVASPVGDGVRQHVVQRQQIHVVHGNVVAAHRLALCACDACAARAAPNMEEADVNELGAVEAVVVDLVHNDDFKVDALETCQRSQLCRGGGTWRLRNACMYGTKQKSSAVALRKGTTTCEMSPAHRSASLTQSLCPSVLLRWDRALLR